MPFSVINSQYRLLSADFANKSYNDKLLTGRNFMAFEHTELIKAESLQELIRYILDLIAKDSKLLH